MSVRSSRISGFYKMSMEKRLEAVAEIAGLGPDTVEHLRDTGNLNEALADSLIENVVGTLNVPLGIATNMVIDDQEVLIPMATEESSVVAAVSNAARLCRDSGGFRTGTSGSLMIAQIQLLGVSNPDFCRLQILERYPEIKAICDDTDPTLLKHQGGLREVEVRVLRGRFSDMVVTHLIVDTRDAMGANAINSMAEAVAPAIAKWTGGRTNLRILSNLADRRLARARCTWNTDTIGGTQVRDAILSACDFAEVDPYRATTHNKGIMNGVSAVVLATGNDTRAVESGAHAYAARSGGYRPLTHWEADAEGNLTGTLEMPLAVGLIGGATRAHPTARASLEIMGINTADRLARNIAAVGLAQNFAALNALATTGIQKGHMALHAKNIAFMAGAKDNEIDKVAKRMVQEGKVRMDVAERIIAELRDPKG